MNYIFKVVEDFGANNSIHTDPSTVFLDNIPNIDAFQTDMNQLIEIDYLNEIIDALQSLVNGTRVEPYNWGHVIYDIRSDAQNCSCHNTFLRREGKADLQLVLSTVEVLSWIMDWRAFVIQWRVEYLGQDPNLFV